VEIRCRRPGPALTASAAKALTLMLTLSISACSPGTVVSQGGDQASISGYTVLREVQLPGDTSRWDYQTYDPVTHRLYIAHLGQSQVVAFDTQTQKVVAVVDNVSDVHGLVVASDIRRLFASATGRDEVAVIDTVSLKVIASVPAGSYPDGIAYAPEPGRIFVSDEQGSGDTVIDVRTNKRLGQIDLGGDIGNSQYDQSTGMVYVAIGSTEQLAVIDPHTNAVVATYSIAGCSGAHGVQIDTAANHRAFVACEDNSKLVVFDLKARRSTAVLDVGDTPDVLALDPSLGRLYVAAESGRLAVFDVAGPDVKKIAEGNAGPNAHTVSVDPATHIVYLPLTNLGGHPVLRELKLDGT
jgi:YVTN family beta-propeller protein